MHSLPNLPLMLTSNRDGGLPRWTPKHALVTILVLSGFRLSLDPAATLTSTKAPTRATKSLVLNLMSHPLSLKGECGPHAIPTLLLTLLFPEVRVGRVVGGAPEGIHPILTSDICLESPRVKNPGGNLKNSSECSKQWVRCCGPPRNERFVLGFILVVDDDPGAAEAISALLEGAGLETRRAHSGEDALAVARERRPQMVLLDVRLPGVSGYEVLRALRDRFGESLPIMFVSGERVEPFDRVAGLQLGADDYLVKPFAPDELIARVRRLVERSASNGQEAVAAKLTRREAEVLRLLASGRAQPEIAKQLVISSSTVASHIEHILGKLDVHSRAEAVAVAHRSGFLTGDPMAASPSARHAQT